MQGIFQKENTDKALKYGIYRHLPTYEKIIRNLVSFYLKNTRLFFGCTAGTVGIFAVFYVIVFVITAKEYYKIVE